MRDIQALARTATEPEKLERLIEILDDNHGYALYQSVSALKIALSEAGSTTFAFSAGSVRIQRPVSRAQFETWIAPELQAIETAVDAALLQFGLGPDQIDRVFLTGGTSLVPAARRIFQSRFGSNRIETGGEFEPIASGLALIGREPDLDVWSHRLHPEAWAANDRLTSPTSITPKEKDPALSDGVSVLGDILQAGSSCRFQNRRIRRLRRHPLRLSRDRSRSYRAGARSSGLRPAAGWRFPDWAPDRVRVSHRSCRCSCV